MNRIHSANIKMFYRITPKSTAIRSARLMTYREVTLN